MRILYGVQGTGNGHVSRANAISECLKNYPEVEVSWLLSGREANTLFNVAGRHITRRGLTFASVDGQINYLQTMLGNNVFVLCNDIARLALKDYDCLVTDYEPVLSWAAKIRGLKTIGIGHQYAFKHKVPWRGDNVFNRTLMNNFAPATINMGLHWHHFNQPILPPICDVQARSELDVCANKVVVYLPFENQERVLGVLRNLLDWQFYIYGPELVDNDIGHIKTRALSRAGFKQDLMSCSAVITNAGFELVSECLALGIKVLTKPVAKQVEQLSNGAALESLGYAKVIDSIGEQAVADWLANSKSVRVKYPAVHESITEWLVSGQQESVESLSEKLWANVEVDRCYQPDIHLQQT